jgi:hypothetical protein
MAPCIPVKIQLQRLKLAQLLGQLGVFFTCDISIALASQPSIVGMSSRSAGPKSTWGPQGQGSGGSKR